MESRGKFPLTVEQLGFQFLKSLSRPHPQTSVCFIMLLVMFVSVGLAQEKAGGLNPPLGLEGTWDVELEGCKFVRRATVALGRGRVAFEARDDSRGWRVAGVAENPDGERGAFGIWSADVSDDGVIAFSLGRHGFSGSRLTVVGNALDAKGELRAGQIVGEWRYRDDRGKTTWRKRPSIQIESVIFNSQVRDDRGRPIVDKISHGQRPGIVRRSHPLNCGYGNMRANCPKFSIEAMGKHFAGLHSVWIDPAYHLEITPGYLCSDGSVGEWSGCGGGDQIGDGVVGIRMQVLVRNDVTPGRKVLYIDEQPIPFDLEIKGFPESQAGTPAEAADDSDTGIREQKVRLALLGPGGVDGEPIDTIEGAVPFRVELKYPELPKTAPETVTIFESEGSNSIHVQATNDPNVFRSDWYSLASDTERGFREVAGLNVPSPDESARIAAELFVGRWYVSSSGGQLDGALGQGFVNDTGTEAQLYLKVGETERLYDAFEMLATKDVSGGRHTLDIRFEELGFDDQPLARDMPEIRVLYVNEETEGLAFAVDSERLEVPITLPQPHDERIRVSLICDEGGKQLSGSWYTELPSGDLGDGGQQTWARATTKIDGVIVVDNQLDASAGYNYPYSPDGSKIEHLHTTRTLVVYGSNLPEFADGAAIESLSEAITYETDSRSGNDRKLVVEKAFKKAEVENFDQYDAFILKASLAKGIKPGTKTLSVNTENLSWPLIFADQLAVVSFVRTAGDMEMATSVFYPGDIGYVKLSFKANLPLEGIPIMISTGRLSNPLEHGVLLAKRMDDDDPVFKNYITEPIHLYHFSNTALSPPDDANALRIPVLEGTEINARLVDSAEVLAFPPVVQAKILANPNQLGPLWKEALDRVAVCYDETIEDYDKYQNEEATRISRVIIAELKRLNIPIKKGDHAAAILIRDEFIKSTMESIPEFEKRSKNIEYVAAFRERAKTSEVLADDPFWHTFEAVHVKEGTLWDTETTVPLAETLDEGALAKKLNISDADAKKWAEEQTMAASLKQIDLMHKSVSWAQDAGDCSMDKLLLIAGHRSPEIVGRILPRLVKLKSDPGPPERQYWIADRPAQAFVKSLYIAGEAVRALEAYSEADTQVALAVAAILTMGTSAALEGLGYAGAALWTQLAMDFGDMAYGAVGVKKYIDGENYYDFATGASPALGEGILDDAYGKRRSAVMTAVGALLPPVSGASNFSQLRHFKNVQRGKELFESTDNVLDGLSTLKEADRAALAGYYTDMLAKVRKSGIDKLDEADRTAFNAFQDYFDFQRVNREAQDALGRPLSVSQQKALNQAHLYGTLGPDGQYSWGDLRVKRQMLLDGDFTKTEATLLMRRGIAGKAKIPKRPVTEQFGPGELTRIDVAWKDTQPMMPDDFKPVLREGFIPLRKDKESTWVGVFDTRTRKIVDGPYKTDLRGGKPHKAMSKEAHQTLFTVSGTKGKNKISGSSNKPLEAVGFEEWEIEKMIRDLIRDPEGFSARTNGVD